ncbi:AzlD domain-containing protein [Leptolyngbya sp. FACHB-261]|uniref:AzlD domain-containing protein n=1 Tax=Leptolyngbya sp. FACHB-261 TaxID=2692806 RepID=UPI001689D480|nr:AzlD domain-containing protein [Leptolyngbya sp. FACHB-261]MBD2099649.1 AzlD domain-containing protein [Leptolyngbya sp. FACHB-261]
MNEVYVIGGMALVTFAIRYTMFALSGRLQFSEPFIKALRYVPPAVLTAIVVPAVVIPTGSDLQLSYTNARLIAALIACAVSWFSQNLLLTIVVGMMAFLGWQWLLLTGLV